MTDLDSRLARLEEKFIHMEDSFSEHKDETTEVLKQISHSLIELQTSSSKQQGFIGGIVFIIGSLATVATIVINKYF